MLRDSSVSVNFTHNSFLTLKSVSRNCAKSQSRNTQMPMPLFWTQEAQAAWEDLKNAILSYPHTDFSSLGFGFVLLQPGNDTASTEAADNYRAGKGFSFMAKGSAAVLHPVCFGARCTRGNKVRFHSHLREGFSGDHAITNAGTTYCRYAIKFILSFNTTPPTNIITMVTRLPPLWRRFNESPQFNAWAAIQRGWLRALRRGFI